MTRVIIKHTVTGEVQSVSDLAGYDESEWEVLAIEREPLPNEVWNESTGAWVLDTDRATAQSELAEVIDRARLLQALKAARQRIKTLENQMAQAISEIQSLKSRVTALENAP